MGFRFGTDLSGHLAVGERRTPQFELMGLANMALVQNQGSGHGLDAGDVTFFQMVAEIGMKEALRYRSDGIDGGVMRV